MEAGKCHHAYRTFECVDAEGGFKSPMYVAMSKSITDISHKNWGTKFLLEGKRCNISLSSIPAQQFGWFQLDWAKGFVLEKKLRDGCSTNKGIPQLHPMAAHLQLLQTTQLQMEDFDFEYPHQFFMKWNKWLVYLIVHLAKNLKCLGSPSNF
jgi:hypothetical protein